MALNTEVYDLGYSGGELRALVPAEGGSELKRLPMPFKPYCYIEEDGLDLNRLRRTGCSIGSGAPDGYLKIEADNPGAVRDFRDEALVDTYEADVGYVKRVMIDEPLSVAVPEPGDILYFDIEVDDRGDFAEPNTARDRIISIAAVDRDGREVYYDHDDEEELVRAFLNDAAGYTVLVGWNSAGYDFEYLENRAEAVGLMPDWGQWVRHDLMPLYDMLGRPTETLSTRLEDTGQREFGEGKTGVRAGDGRLYELWDGGDGRLREYNLRDADLVRRIDEEYDGLVKLLHTICDIASYPPGDAIYETKYGESKFAIGQVVDSKLLETAHQKGIPQSDKRSYDKPDDFPGGYVLEPEPGLYEDVVVPDYSGMYPNIVRAWNFGEETWASDDALEMDDDGEWYITEGEHEGARAIRGEHGGFVHPDDGPRSVPAETADELVKMREGASEVVDKGVKAVNNTLYGVFAAEHQRYLGPHSRNITLVGQELTGIVEELAGRGHDDIYDVIYGDTDSVMISMADPDDPVGAAKRIASDLESEMQAWAGERGALSRFLELDVDDVYDRFYIGDKKKRYFGHRTWKDGHEADDMKIRGFVARQHSTPAPVRNFQRDLMEAVLDGEPTGPVISEYKDRLFGGEWDTELATRKSLGKPVDEYEGATPPVHARAAEAIREEFGEDAVSVGSKIGYVMTGPNTRDWTWVHDGELGEPLNVRAYQHLWRDRFVTAMHAIGVTVHDQTALSDFA